MNICVFCGSSSGTDPSMQKPPESLDNLFQKHSSLVYGGGNIGLMGILADEVLASHGKVMV